MREGELSIRPLVRAVAVLLVLALLMLVTSGCAGGKGGSRKASSAIRGTSGDTGGLMAQLQTLHYVNDGDGDPVTDGDGDGDIVGDRDNDPIADHRYANDNQLYIDRDDKHALVFGHSADTADRAAITALVRRYYAAAAMGNGRAACATLTAHEAQRVPTEAGLLGFFLRGSKTCNATLTHLFRHFHTSLRGVVVITAVQVNGAHALALLGSTTMHAGYITAGRARGQWRIELPLGGSPLANALL